MSASQSHSPYKEATEANDKNGPTVACNRCNDITHEASVTGTQLQAHDGALLKVEGESSREVVPLNANEVDPGSGCVKLILPVDTFPR
jgi:hypothetical protein